MYHNTEDLRGEPHTVAIRGEDDVHVTEEVYKRPLFLQPTYRYRGPVLHRTPGCWACCSLGLSSTVASVSPSAGGAEFPVPISHGNVGGRGMPRVCGLPDGLLPLTWQVPPPAPA